MTVEASPAIRGTPWHLWLVGLLSLLWNGFGAYDYAMSHLQGDAYYRAAGMSQAQIAYFHGFPPWMELFWAMGVWGAVIGSVLLLLRSRWAVPVLLVSLVGAVVSLLYQTVLSRGVQVFGSGAYVSVFITVVAALLAWYAWAMRRRGVLA